MIAVWKRELFSYLKSPVGYIYLFLYLIISGSVINAFNLQANDSDLSGYFSFNCFISSFKIRNRMYWLFRSV